MIISRRQRFLFLHIPKNGGSSIRHILRRRVMDARTFRRCRKHGLLADALAELGDEADQFFTFAIVRNPWDRMVSWYSMIRACTANRPWHRRISGRTRNLLWLYVAETAKSFDEFILKCTDPPARARRLLFNQLDYLNDAQGDMRIDFVGRFDAIERDMTTVFDRIGLPKVKLPHRNSSKHRHYSRYYTDETRDAVAERYARDIGYFGFQFDDRRF